MERNGFIPTTDFFSETEIHKCHKILVILNEYGTSFFLKNTGKYSMNMSIH